MVTSDNLSGHAFISYVREDAAHVDQLQRMLEAAGVRVWRDTADLWPGEDWRVKIRQAITDEALVFIACFSRQSTARSKSYQYEEVVLAIEQLRQRRPDEPWLIPVRLDDCNIPEFDLGAGRTLASIQRADLFGDRRDEGIAKLIAGVLRVLGKQPQVNIETVVQQTGREPAVRIKELLPVPERVIELEDLVMGIADECAEALADSANFPTSSDDAQSDTVRYLVTQTDHYFNTVRPLAEVLVVGCTFDRGEHGRLWRRAVEGVAGIEHDERNGLEVLVGLRAYPVLPLIYAAGMACIWRENWIALRAVSVDAQVRDRNQPRRKIPLIAAADLWAPFQALPLAVQVLAVEDQEGRRLTGEEIESLATGRIGKRHTPLSDHIHARLRPLFKGLIRDDADYDDVFDGLEVVFGILASDAELQAHELGEYLSGPSIGSFTWRRRHADPPFAHQVWKRYGRQLLAAQFFGGSDIRADLAFEAFSTFAAEARRHRVF